MSAERERIFGLDFLRAAAVIFVIFHHSLDYICPYPWLRPIGEMGSLGVEFLLILTGYLLGHSVLGKMRRNQFSRSQLKTYYFKRWIRTLPPYYFFLLLMATIAPNFWACLWEHREYFVFGQNLAWPIPPFYVQTWTLAIQEAFYLICPLFILAGSRFFRHRRVAFFVPMAILILIPLVLRALHTQVESSVGFDNTIRHWVVFRLDTPVFGVFLAYAEVEFPSLWSWLQRNSWPGFVLFALVACYYLMGLPFLFSSHWLQVFFYPIISFCIMFIFPFLCDWRKNRSLFGDAIRGVSNMTYTLYVSHFIAFYLGWMLLLVCSVDSAPLSYAVYIFFIWVVAYPSYLLIEAPLLRLREAQDRSQPGPLGILYRRIVARLAKPRPFESSKPETSAKAAGI